MSCLWGSYATLNQAKYIFPVNHHGNHWIIVYADLRKGYICAINPMNPNTADDHSRFLANRIAAFLNALFDTRLSYVNMDTYLPKQRDGYNCGIYILMYMLLFCLHLDKILTLDPSQTRLLSVLWIVRGYI